MATSLITALLVLQQLTIIALVSVVALLWNRVGRIERDAETGWAAINETMDEVKTHLGALYRKTEVLPDGGVVRE